MVKWIRFPFGLNGDRAAIPDEADPGGSVSFSQGFGPDYELELGVDPTAKPVPREESNELYFILSDNQRDYQLTGAPPWFPASANNGVAIPYPVNAVVRHGTPPLIYRSLVATNTVEPGTDPASWAVDGVAVLASTSTAGLARLATNPEAIARTAADRVLTPSNMAALWALLLNNPVFPEVLTANGLFTLSNPAGNVRIAAGTSWVHRGVETYTSVQTDLPTVASKTYHLRWSPTGGFALFDLSSGAYNPSAVPETDPSFDTTYDNMLVARVVTNAGNAATITGLSNLHALALDTTVSGPGEIFTTGSGNDGVRFVASPVLNWSRAPKIFPTMGWVGQTGANADINGFANRISNRAATRYSITAQVDSDWNGSLLGATVTGTMIFQAYSS